MLKVKSFKIEDDKGQNELLEKYRLAQGGLTISNGWVCVPYDDGEPEDKHHTALLFKELRNKKLSERQMAVFEQRLVAKQAIEFNQELIELKEKQTNAPKGKEKYNEEKKIKERISLMENKVIDVERQQNISIGKLSLIDSEIEVFNEIIKENED